MATSTDSQSKQQSTGEYLHQITSNRRELERMEYLKSATYGLNYDHTGKFVIFNHYSFEPRLNAEERKGTYEDVLNLLKLFKDLRFTPAFPDGKGVYDDLTKCEIKQKLKELSVDDFTKCASLLVVVLTHGNRDQITEKPLLYAKDRSYLLEEIWEPFKAENQTLVGKPKIFLIQGCTGMKKDYGIRVKDQAEESEEVESEEVESKQGIRIPIMSDFLIALGSFPGYVSFRDPENGSWFIETFCKVVELFKDDSSLQEMLTFVTYDIAYNKEADVGIVLKQVPLVQSSLTKLFYLSSTALSNAKDKN